MIHNEEYKNEWSMVPILKKQKQKQKINKQTKPPKLLSQICCERWMDTCKNRFVYIRKKSFMAMCMENA